MVIRLGRITSSHYCMLSSHHVSHITEGYAEAPWTATPPLKARTLPLPPPPTPNPHPITPTLTCLLPPCRAHLPCRTPLGAPGLCPGLGRLFLQSGVHVHHVRPLQRSSRSWGGHHSCGVQHDCGSCGLHATGCALAVVRPFFDTWVRRCFYCCCTKCCGLWADATPGGARGGGGKRVES